jgi:hypothetical protein
MNQLQNQGVPHEGLTPDKLFRRRQSTVEEIGDRAAFQEMPECSVISINPLGWGRGIFPGERQRSQQSGEIQCSARAYVFI